VGSGAIGNGNASVRMTLTAPNCPVADNIVADVRGAVGGVPGVASAHDELTFDPARSRADPVDLRVRFEHLC